MSTRGRLLVATPALDDPNFTFTVIYMLEDGEDGSLGVVLTRASELPVSGMFDQWETSIAPPTTIFVGGPVAPASVIALARGSIDPDHPAWSRIGLGIGTIDLDADPHSVHGLRQVRLFAGYASWAPGQLDAELAQDAWYVLDADPGDIFTATPDHLWWSVMARQHGELRVLRHYPIEPWNN